MLQNNVRQDEKEREEKTSYDDIRKKERERQNQDLAKHKEEKENWRIESVVGMSISDFSFRSFVRCSVEPRFHCKCCYGHCSCSDSSTSLSLTLFLLHFINQTMFLNCYNG